MFYALGNIGDSKKTDYTRAYDPDDMNEFTVENSDNNTDNGQFQSGVHLSNLRYRVTNPVAEDLSTYEESTDAQLVEGSSIEYTGTFTKTSDVVIMSNKTYYIRRRLLETDYPAWIGGTAYIPGNIVIYDYRMYRCLTANDSDIWATAQWEDITPITSDTIYYAPRTNPNPMDYIYPVTPEEWNLKMTVADSTGKYHYVNRKHDTLVELEFDGDHSFEFRYACRGDYRDGDSINTTAGQDNDTQEVLNHDTVLAFYEWLVTSTEDQFREEASLWFVKGAMEFFYAYTHYYTMMDNRAKNTFWHFAKTGTHLQVSRPVKELLHIYDELLGTEYVRTEDTEINPEKTYYTQYAFDLWSYDMDKSLSM